jgi:hypothetical protein
LAAQLEAEGNFVNLLKFFEGEDSLFVDSPEGAADLIEASDAGRGFFLGCQKIVDLLET